MPPRTTASVRVPAHVEKRESRTRSGIEVRAREATLDLPPPVVDADDGPPSSEGHGRGGAGLLGALVALLGAVTLATYAARRLGADAQFVSLGAHTAAEAAGGMVAIVVAGLSLLAHERDDAAHAAHLRRVRASAFAIVGTLDLLHGCVPPGDLFVWLHALAALVGGAVFALAWLAPRAAQATRALPAALFGITLATAVASMVRPEHVPAMVRDGRFTPLAMAMNVLGGVGFLAAAARLASLPRATRAREDGFFAAQCVLFGVAALSFPISRMWGPNWWLWHVLRIGACFVALAYVVTRFRTIERRLERTNDALREALRVRDDFLAIASHELRTPLTPIVLRLQALSRVAAQGHAIDATQIDKALAASRRLARLVDELLDTTRISAGELALRFEATSLNELVRGYVEPFRASNPDHRIELEEGAELRVDADRARLRQVLGNLLDNAVKHTPKGGAIRVELSSSHGDARLTVSDDGAGIPHDEQPSLFDRYFRAREARTQHRAGLGLGLYVCHDIVRRHGGRIWVQSEPGEGATFIVALPMRGSVAAGTRPLDD